MPRTKKLGVAEAIEAIAMIEWNLTAFEETAPETVAAFGGRVALARISQMCCFGPVPQLDVGTWQRMSEEYEERRRYGDLADSHAATFSKARPAPEQGPTTPEEASMKMRERRQSTRRGEWK